MKKPPAVATAILMRLGPDDESVVGDLLEEYRTGRSQAWYWRQVMSAVVLDSIREVCAHPGQTFAAIAPGWVVLLVVFAAGDTFADGLAGLFWNWNRRIGYGTGVWWPFQISAAVVSYAGFAISACVVARTQRRRTASTLVAYVASVVGALAVSAVVLEVLTWRAGNVPVPHPLFYFVSVTLPLQWRSGFLLVPTILLLAGICGTRARRSTAS